MRNMVNIIFLKGSLLIISWENYIILGLSHGRSKVGGYGGIEKDIKRDCKISAFPFITIRRYLMSKFS